MLSPGRLKMERIDRDGLITTDNITHTNHSYGPGALSHKEKGTKKKIPSISIDIIKVLPSITSLYPNVTACGDVLLLFKKFVLFGSISLNI